MKAFHNDEAVKHKYLNRVIAHQKADHLIRGQGWTGTKGCAVGCTLEKYDHFAYETELGIPEWLARVEDELFEGMSEIKSRTWPENFLSAIKPGVNLEQVKIPFIIKILERNLKSLDVAKFDAETFPQVKEVIDQSREATIEMIRCHREGLDLSAARSAGWSAEEAAWSAESAARSAAWSAVRSAVRSAESAARSAARSAASAARSAESAARSAGWSAEAAARSAESAARSAAWSAEAATAAAAAAYDEMADELLALLENAK